MDTLHKRVISVLTSSETSPKLFNRVFGHVAYRQAEHDSGRHKEEFCFLYTHEREYYEYKGVKKSRFGRFRFYGTIHERVRASGIRYALAVLDSDGRYSFCKVMDWEEVDSLIRNEANEDGEASTMNKRVSWRKFFEEMLE
jgi:hypothetical protein